MYRPEKETADLPGRCGKEGSQGIPKGWIAERAPGRWVLREKGLWRKEKPGKPNAPGGKRGFNCRKGERGPD